MDARFIVAVTRKCVKYTDFHDFFVFSRSVYVFEREGGRASVDILVSSILDRMCCV